MGTVSIDCVMVSIIFHVLLIFRGDAPIIGVVWESLVWEEEKLGFV